MLTLLLVDPDEPSQPRKAASGLPVESGPNLLQQEEKI
jgi:hypothetical protein